MTDLPKLALSVRQPWAWAIVHASKPVENRSWKKGNPGLKFRGDVCVHASKGMTRAEYEEAADFMASIGITVPPAADLLRGGIVGVTCIVDIVSELNSPWFFGPKGLLLADTKPVDFIPSVGALGFFAWKPAPESVPATKIIPEKPELKKNDGSQQLELL